ncbi:hypothetical protein MTO96_021009 [Rhipicephalus appendiculatus]
MQGASGVQSTVGRDSSERKPRTGRLEKGRREDGGEARLLIVSVEERRPPRESRSAFSVQLAPANAGILCLSASVDGVGQLASLVLPNALRPLRARLPGPVFSINRPPPDAKESLPSCSVTCRTERERQRHRQKMRDSPPFSHPLPSLPNAEQNGGGCKAA